MRQAREKITMKTNEEKTVWGHPYGVETEEKNKEVSVSPRTSVNIHSPIEECNNIWDREAFAIIYCFGLIALITIMYLLSVGG